MLKLSHILLLLLLAHNLYGYATEASIKNYQEEFCKDMDTDALTLEYNQSKTALENYISSGSKACQNAGDTIKIAQAKREGRKLYDECESYRYGKIRKEIHKLKIKTKAIKRELELRKR